MQDVQKNTILREICCLELFNTTSVAGAICLWQKMGHLS